MPKLSLHQLIERDEREGSGIDYLNQVQNRIISPTARQEAVENLLATGNARGLSLRVICTGIEFMDTYLRTCLLRCCALPVLAHAALELAVKMHGPCNTPPTASPAGSTDTTPTHSSAMEELERRVMSVLEYELGDALVFLFLDEVEELVWESLPQTPESAERVRSSIKMAQFYIGLSYLDYTASRLSRGALAGGAFCCGLQRAGSPDVHRWVKLICRRFALHRCEMNQVMNRMDRIFEMFSAGYNSDPLVTPLPSLRCTAEPSSPLFIGSTPTFAPSTGPPDGYPTHDRVLTSPEKLSLSTPVTSAFTPTPRSATPIIRQNVRQRFDFSSELDATHLALDPGTQSEDH